MKKFRNVMLVLALICCLLLTVTACKKDVAEAPQVEAPAESAAETVPEAPAVEEVPEEAAEEIPEDATIVSMTGPAEAAVGGNAVYTVACENTEGFATATFNVEIAGGCTEEPVVEGLNNFTVLMVDFDQVEDKWVGEMILMNLQGLTSEENVPVVSIDCACVNGGTITAELTDSLLSAYVGDTEDWVDTAYGETVVTTEVK